jgi:hypothetical protein
MMLHIALIVNNLFTRRLSNLMNVRLVMVQDNVEIVREREKYMNFMKHIQKDVKYVMEPVYANHVKGNDE